MLRNVESEEHSPRLGQSSTHHPVSVAYFIVLFSSGDKCINVAIVRRKSKLDILM
jgi:hypothetical protein